MEGGPLSSNPPPQEVATKEEASPEAETKTDNKSADAEQAWPQEGEEPHPSNLEDMAAPLPRKESSILKRSGSSAVDKAVKKGVSWGASADRAVSFQTEEAPSSSAAESKLPMGEGGAVEPSLSGVLRTSGDMRRSRFNIPRLELETNLKNSFEEEGGRPAALLKDLGLSQSSVSSRGSVSSRSSFASSHFSHLSSTQEILSSAFHTVYKKNYLASMASKDNPPFVRADMLAEHPASLEVFGFPCRSLRESRLCSSRSAMSTSSEEEDAEGGFGFLESTSSQASAKEAMKPAIRRRPRFRFQSDGSRAEGASTDSLSSIEAPHALVADLLEHRCSVGEDMPERKRSVCVRRSGIMSKLSLRKSARSLQRTPTVSAMELERSEKRYEAEVFSEILEKVNARAHRRGERPEVYEQLAPEKKKTETHLPASPFSEGFFTDAPGKANVEIRTRKIDPEWAFQQFSGKKIDGEARFDDSLEILYEEREEVKLHGYSRFQKESAKERYDRLVREVPHAIVGVREYSSNMNLLEKIHKEEEDPPEGSRAAYVLRLNDMLRSQREAVGALVKDYVAADVTLQNVLFGRTNFTLEGELVDVDLFDAYCPDDCLPVNAVASSAFASSHGSACAQGLGIPIRRGVAEPAIQIRDGAVNEGIALANFERRLQTLEGRLEDVCNLIDENRLLPQKSLTRDALDKFKADSRSFAAQLTAMDNVLSHALSEPALNRLELRLQVVKSQMEEQEAFVRSREQQRAREKQRQVESGAADPADLVDLPDDWKPETLLKRLHESLISFKGTAERIDEIGGKLESAFAARKPLVDFLKKMHNQEKQNEVVLATLGSAVQMLQALNGAHAKAKETAGVSPVLGFFGAEAPAASPKRKSVAGLESAALGLRSGSGSQGMSLLPAPSIRRTKTGSSDKMEPLLQKRVSFDLKSRATRVSSKDEAKLQELLRKAGLRDTLKLKRGATESFGAAQAAPAAEGSNPQTTSWRVMKFKSFS
ncbi:hypothetical protein BESB_056830 [Besnoitia besnoiti]|uniref:Uncharacterized protein n=1 Tax=Besnoitia besnoiti TaxID=94643 RepID=A0A2A9MKS7_BESBE|nr:hypothetical protein BESB_056830 [Besnoitia besnoiti]PFH36032.1 hypothetical protein BESB_056830 [Besnoitia besnoiti]